MFDFIGKTMVLQPDASASFVGGEGLHPLLPPVAGLFVLREPARLSSVAGGSPFPVSLLFWPGCLCYAAWRGWMRSIGPGASSA